MIPGEGIIKQFIARAKKPLVVLLGPTGAGKTSLSLRLAKRFGGEIINADSRQIYWGMDIGTNKIKAEEMQHIEHHLFSFKNPNEIYTVAEYKQDAMKVIEDILRRKCVPFLVGGTGLYINAICFNYDIPQVAPNYQLRQKLDEQSSELLYQQLMELDPVEAKKIHPNQRRYLIRALEIALSGKVKSREAKRKRHLYNCLFLGLHVSRDTLHQRINQRVDIMIEDGLVQEVQKLKQMGYDEKSHAMNGIGYKEVLEYLAGNISLAPTIELIKQHTRQYAKRQMTWFRRIKDIHWLHNSF